MIIIIIVVAAFVVAAAAVGGGIGNRGTLGEIATHPPTTGRTLVCGHNMKGIPLFADGWTNGHI